MSGCRLKWNHHRSTITDTLMTESSISSHMTHSAPKTVISAASCSVMVSGWSAMGCDKVGMGRPSVNRRKPLVIPIFGLPFDDRRAPG